MMLTRCPHCATAFRVTPEQLRVRGGQVRCGHCQGVFNALDYLEEEGPMPTRPVLPRPEAAEPWVPTSRVPTPEVASMGAEPQTPAAPPAQPEAPVTASQVEVEDLPSAEVYAGEAAHLAQALKAGPEILDEERVEPAPQDIHLEPRMAPPRMEPHLGFGVVSVEAEPFTPVVSPLGDDFLETPEQNTITPDIPLPEQDKALAQDEADETAVKPAVVAGQRGLPAGLNALDDDGLTALLEPSGASHWLYGLAIGLLSLLLLAQALYQFRTPLASNSVVMASLYKVLGVQVPLARVTEQVSIEASDLQADASKGQLVLGATLKNRANFAQDWPALELTLTDARDGVLSRRVLYPADYLPADAPPVLAMRGELAIKLWLSVGKLNAAGYRLYVFYP